ncbi:hypothetical protein RB195_007502 [Necator americanus]|uniref:Uncharacterized protein n=1 Tax=Necator americanus TaxID=51031 RepID=A0ABR1C120_NECAM
MITRRVEVCEGRKGKKEGNLGSSNDDDDDDDDEGDEAANDDDDDDGRVCGQPPANNYAWGWREQRRCGACVCVRRVGVASSSAIGVNAMRDNTRERIVFTPALATRKYTCTLCK